MKCARDHPQAVLLYSINNNNVVRDLHTQHHNADEAYFSHFLNYRFEKKQKIKGGGEKKSARGYHVQLSRGGGRAW